jgi:hypothetical protein
VAYSKKIRHFRNFVGQKISVREIIRAEDFYMGKALTRWPAPYVSIKGKNRVVYHGREPTATYGGFYQPLRCWSKVYDDYIRREALEWDLPSQYLADIDIMRTQPIMSEIKLIAWTWSNFNVDMVVGSTGQTFHLLHNTQAFYQNGDFQVAGISGQTYSSPFRRISGLQTAPIFRKELEAAGDPVQSFIISPPFLTKYILHHTLSDYGLTPKTLSRAVQMAAREHFTSVFAKYAIASPTATEMTACYWFLVSFEQFLRIAKLYPHLIFVQDIRSVTEEMNTHLRNVTFWPLRLQESRFWRPTEQGKYDRITAPVAYKNVSWGPTMSMYEIERQFPVESGQWHGLDLQKGAVATSIGKENNNKRA